ncbi:MAG: hypothetical protein ACYCUV_12585 [Phycisphaerae bacterium]
MAKREQFRFFTLFRRITAVMDDDALVLLEHQYNKDRIRRVPFDQVEYMLHWERLAGGRLTLFFLLFLGFGISGIAFLANRSFGDTGYLVFGIILLVFAVGMLALIGATLAMGRHHLLVFRAESKTHLSGIMRAKKFKRLLTDMTARTREVQAALARTAAATANTTAIPLPETPTPAVSAEERSPDESGS